MHLENRDNHHNAQYADYCAIDFGTSNSALAVIRADIPELVALEGTATNLPSALFYPTDPAEPVLIGRAAIRAYLEFEEGRLLRSLKSVLGSALIHANTELGPGRQMNFGELIADYLARLKHQAEKVTGTCLNRVLLGRPAFFVDDAPDKDREAQASLEAAARQAGFKEVAFEFEPVAAAMTFASDPDYSESLETGNQIKERWAFVADLGGGTCDFSVLSMREDQQRILANHGVHIAGTDFDRRVSLTQIMPLLGLGAINANGRAVPNSIYRELSTWHLVNGLYTRKSKAELHTHRDMYGSRLFYARLSKVLEEKLGHQLLAQAEQAKIQSGVNGSFNMQFENLEKGLGREVSDLALHTAITKELEAIVLAAAYSIESAGVKPTQVNDLYFTGGSSGLRSLREAIADLMPNARLIEGERFEAVALGLGLAANLLWRDT